MGAGEERVEFVVLIIDRLGIVGAKRRAALPVCRDGEEGRQQDDAADTFEFEDQFDDSGEPIEDYYLPSDPSGDTE